jgi:hypothetical protein
MVDVETLNTLKSTLSPLLYNNFNVSVIHFLSIFFVNLAAYAYVLVKFFKVLCYSKLTFDWLPMINPYIWPFSIFNVLTGPYFKLWSRILPTVKMEKSSLEISGIIALEALNSITFFLVRLTNLLVVVLDQTEKELLLNITN